MNKDNNDNGGPKDKDRDMLDSECSEETAEYEYDEEELSRNVHASRKCNEREEMQAIAEEFLEWDQAKNIRKLDYEAILENTIKAYRQAYKDGKWRDYDYNMTLIYARFNNHFKWCISKILDGANIRELIDREFREREKIKKRNIMDHAAEDKNAQEERVKFSTLQYRIPREDLEQDALNHVWAEVTAYIKDWAENKKIRKEGFSFRKHMDEKMPLRALNYFKHLLPKRTGNLFTEGVVYNPNADENTEDGLKTRKLKETVNTQEYTEIRIVQQRTNPENIVVNRETIRMSIYKVMNTASQIDKIITTLFCKFLQNTKEQYYDIAIGSTFNELFEVFLNEAEETAYIDREDIAVVRFKERLQTWERYIENLDVKIDANYMITEEIFENMMKQLSSWLYRS